MKKGSEESVDSVSEQPTVDITVHPGLPLVFPTLLSSIVVDSQLGVADIVIDIVNANQLAGRFKIRYAATWMQFEATA